MSTIEYRCVYRRHGDTHNQYRDGFPKMDVNWGGYFHGIWEADVIRWEQRTISDWTPVS